MSAAEAQRVVHEADVCVIGAGAGGAVVAAELAEGGARVVLLEQGPGHDIDKFSARPPEMLNATCPPPAPSRIAWAASPEAPV